MRHRRNEELQKKRFQLLNKIFLAWDAFLTLTNLILTLSFVRNRCVALMFLYYTFFYSAQTGQHYLLFKLPLIDVNKHYLLYRRLVILICLVDGTYMFSCVIFWQKTRMHPIYCALCEEWGLGSWVGLLLIFHFIFCLAWAVSLIHSYVNRRYYLLALGGFEVEQRILEERRRSRERMMIIEPDVNNFPIPSSKAQKYFKFEDAAEVDLETNECSICYNRDLDSKFVDAGCGHYYHEQCLSKWAQVNTSCPQCRHHFESSMSEPQQPPQP